MTISFACRLCGWTHGHDPIKHGVPLTRYGAPCRDCGVLRDYHSLTPKDHPHRS